MKPSLHLRLSQHLALTPQLQQSIRLLQLSTLELQQEVEQMLEQNPFLEIEAEAVAAPEPLAERLTVLERAGERESESAASSTDSAQELTEDGNALDSTEFGTTEREDWENGTERDDFDGIREMPSNAKGGDGSDDDFDSQEGQTLSLSIQQHLSQQLLGMRLSEEDAAAVRVLIESVNDDGYLETSIEDLADGLVAEEFEREELLERLQCALKWLQGMEPLGVGARDLSECLVLQLRAQPRSQVQQIAIIIC